MNQQSGHRADPFRLLSISSSRALGGLERFQLAVARAMRERGHHVEVVAEPETAFLRAARASDFPTHTLRFHRYLSPLAVLRLARLMRCLKADVLHYRLSRDIWTVAPAARRAGLRGRIVHTLGMNPGGRLDNPAHRWLRNSLGAFVAPTPQTAASAARVWGMKPDEVTRIPNFVDSRPFDQEETDDEAAALRSSWGFSDSEIVVGMLARLEPNKGVETFLDAAVNLVARGEGDSLGFVVGGPVSPGRDFWLKGVRERARARLGERLVFAGLQHRIPTYMRALDIFVLPSHRETFGAVLVEAMMAGRPVVASRGPGPDFILDDGRFGPQFPVRDHAALAELVLRLATDPAERERMARTAWERARETFSHEVIVPAYEDLFQRLRNAGR